MKKTMKSLLGIGFILGVCVIVMSMTYSGGGRIKVYLQNKCSSDVSIRIESPGSATNYTVEDGYTKPDTFLEGTKIYDSKGRLAHTVATGSEGKTIVVCD
ncbi:MAG: hypothetical protein V4604_16450 [Bacteroidota bacterium]